MVCDDGGSVRSAPGGASRAPMYNLFRHRLESELYCAVPEDRAVPGFLTGEGWVYGGTVTGEEAALLGFKEAAARHGAGTIGFYLFLHVPARRGAGGGLALGQGPWPADLPQGARPARPGEAPLPEQVSPA